MSRTTQPLHLRLEAYMACAIPTQSWVFALCQQIRRRLEPERGLWNDAVWDAWIDPDDPPTRACGESKLATPDFKVEIIIVAAK